MAMLNLSLVSVPDVRDLSPEDITGSNAIQISSLFKRLNLNSLMEFYLTLVLLIIAIL